MFSKFIKKSKTVAEVMPVLPQPVEVGPTWESRLQAALGNDTELLALAFKAPSIDHKLAAVQALASEEGLRTAEREFRKHDRRVHSVAKQRYESLLKQRETRVTATQLVQAAAALMEAPVIPSNRLVELNQGWQRLDLALVEEEAKASFARLQTSLADLMRERGENKRIISRWLTAANHELAVLNSACAGVLASDAGLQELAATLAIAREKTQTTLAAVPAACFLTAPEARSLAELEAALRKTLETSAQIEVKLWILGELESSSGEQHGTSNDAQPLPLQATLSVEALGRWQALPLLADPRIESAMNARFNGFLQQHNEVRSKQQKLQQHNAGEKNKAAQQLRIQTVISAANEMESALVAGHLAEAGDQLAILQAASRKGVTEAALQKRIGVLQVEFSRLKGWQHWGGGRVRDDLVVEAEQLAASTIMPEGSRQLKLPIKQLELDIEKMRARWKELDRLGGATSKPLWQRFDGALKTAYLPVAAHLAKMNSERHENLAARNNLLTALDALTINSDAGITPDWKEIGRALAHFEMEWGKLGPLEYTVPHKSQAALLQHLRGSVARLEVPLKEMQLAAQSEREQLIVRASALVQDLQGRDLMVKLRELQAEWQTHAKSHPLPRKTENLLWTAFKAVTDDLMNQREKIFSARDAEFKASETLREALIAQLEALHQDTPASEIRQVLASVDTEWGNAGEVHRNQAARLDSQYRAAREQARQHLAGSARQAWRHGCDALLAKLALCQALESAEPPTDIEARWQSLPALPARWEQALQARYRAGSVNPGGSDSSNSSARLNQLLLQLESALEIPSPPEFQADRRTLKLQAMKKALEGREAAALTAPDIETMTAEILGCKFPGEDQRDRLHCIITALRGRG